MKMNLPLGKRWEGYAAGFGIHCPSRSEQANYGKASTDQGNVSHEIPSIQVVYRIETEGGKDNHTPEFAEVIDLRKSANNQAAKSEGAHQSTINSSKCLTSVAIDFLNDAGFREEVKKAFTISSSQTSLNV